MGGELGEGGVREVVDIWLGAGTRGSLVGRVDQLSKMHRKEETTPECIRFSIQSFYTG